MSNKEKKMWNDKIKKISRFAEFFRVLGYLLLLSGITCLISLLNIYDNNDWQIWLSFIPLIFSVICLWIADTLYTYIRNIWCQIKRYFVEN